MSTKPKMLQIDWALPRLIQLELHLSQHGLAMHELRASGVGEKRIRSLYPMDLSDYTARLSRLALHEPFYTAAMNVLGDITDGASPYYPPLARGIPKSAPTLSEAGFSTDAQLGELAPDLASLMFQAHGVPHEASRSTAALALHLYAAPALLSFYQACALHELTPMHPVEAVHVFKPWVFEEHIDFLIELLQASPF